MQEDTLAVVYAAMDEVEPRSADGGAIEKNPNSRLLGGENGVDSLTFVNLVVAIEEQIHKKLGKSVVLVDEDNMALQDHPFRNVGTLATYIDKVLEKQ